MLPGISDYANRSAVLLQATERFEDALGDFRQQDIATKDLLSAAEQDSFAGVRLGFQVEPGVPPPSSVSGRLSAVLYDLQSANVLIAAGVRTESPNGQGAGNLLQDARQEVATTRDELLSPAAPTGFAAKLSLKSATLESAVGEFRNYSDQLLGEIVSEAGKTIKVASTELSKLDPSEIGKALGQIGEAVPIIASAGQLLRKGLEKLKRAIESLIEMFGKDAFKKIKEQVTQILEAAGVSSQGLLEKVLGTNSVKQRIATILANPSLTIAKVDDASNLLPDLASHFNGDNKLLRAVMRGIQLAGALLVVLHFAAPWLAPTLAIAYVLAIGAAALVGLQYTGAWRTLNWIDGVEQIADKIS
jgi:hypothetical protein